MSRRLFLLAVLPLVASMLGVVAPAAVAEPMRNPCGWREQALRTYDSVVWIVLENHSYSDLIGPAGSPARTTSPYLNQLADSCGLATNSWAIRHPSLPNYLAMVSGNTGGVRDSCTPAQCPQSRRTVFDQVRAKGKDWRVFAESMSRPCQTRNAGPYVARHNPPTYFTGIRGCKRRDLPMGTVTGGPLLDTVDAGRLPALTLVIPNQCNNGHDCPIETGDRWLSTVVPRILAGPDYAEGHTAVFVTWDEGQGGHVGQNCRRERDESCHVVTVAISPTTEPGTTSSTRFDTYSLLETTESMLGIRKHLGHAADRRTRSMRRAFGL